MSEQTISRPRPRIAVLISGNGSNLQALIDARDAGVLTAEIALVVSNRSGAYGLERARQAGIPTLTFLLKTFTKANRSRWEYDEELGERIRREANPAVIVLAGWMHVLSPAFLEQFPNRVINLHPALPGQFPGMHAIERAYDAYRRCEIDYSGCMVHVVTPEIDVGPTIVQAMTPLRPTDTFETFEARMHAVEHRVIVLATQIALMAVGAND